MKASSLRQVSRSELRHRILSSLNLEPASSVTSLSKKLGVLRPSVSRAVRSLQDAGLITRQGRSISLNEAGQEELSHLDAELSVKVKKSTDLATRILEQVTETGTHLGIFNNGSFLQLAETFANSPFFQIGEGLSKSSASHLSEMLTHSAALQLGEGVTKSSLLQLSETIATSPGLQVVKELASSPIFLAAKEATNNASLQVAQALEAINATASIQVVNMGLLQGWREEVFSPLSHLLLENNMLLGTMMVDLETIGANIGTTVSQTLGGLIDQTTRTTKLFDAYFVDVVGGLKHVPTFDGLELSLTIPTAAAASLVGSTKRIVESEIISSSEEPMNLYTARTSTYSERFVVLTPKLEAYLKPLGQRFINKWEGAWQVLYSGSKDRYSQATHSGRELLMQVLAHLAPDDVFTKEDCRKHGVDKPSRKMRIKYILDYDHHSAVEFIDSMATALDRMYDVLVGEAHRRDDNNHLEDTIVGQLAALGASLIMLLSLHSNIQL